MLAAYLWRMPGPIQLMEAGMSVSDLSLRQLAKILISYYVLSSTTETFLPSTSITRPVSPLYLASVTLTQSLASKYLAIDETSIVKGFVIQGMSIALNCTCPSSMEITAPFIPVRSPLTILILSPLAQAVAPPQLRVRLKTSLTFLSSSSDNSWSKFQVRIAL